MDLPGVHDCREGIVHGGGAVGAHGDAAEFGRRAGALLDPLRVFRHGWLEEEMWWASWRCQSVSGGRGVETATRQPRVGEVSTARAAAQRSRCFALARRGDL